MINKQKSPWKVTLVLAGATLALSGIGYAVIARVVQPAPATATFMAGVELDADSIAVTYDTAGAEPVDGARPLQFGPVPDFQDLGAWNPLDSGCVYVHNRSDIPDLGPPTTLTIGVFLNDGGSVGGSVELAQGEGCDVPGYPRAALLTEDQRTIGPGQTFIARVRLILDRSPGEGHFRFGLTFVGVGSDLPLGLSIRSTFDTDGEGWTVVGDAQGGTGIPDYFAEGGSPGGYVSARDDGTGEIWYWRAPSEFLGDRSAAYGKTLRYDLKQDASASVGADDLILSGGGMTLVYDTSPDPGTDWTAYTVPLLESGGWVLRDTGAPVTEAEFLEVLSSLTELLIRGEYSIGLDTGGLDNVELGH